jgi:hypothetical protein
MAARFSPQRGRGAFVVGAPGFQDSIVECDRRSDHPREARFVEIGAAAEDEVPRPEQGEVPQVVVVPPRRRHPPPQVRTRGIGHRHGGEQVIHGILGAMEVGPSGVTRVHGSGRSGWFAPGGIGWRGTGAVHGYRPPHDGGKDGYRTGAFRPCLETTRTRYAQGTRHA